MADKDRREPTMLWSISRRMRAKRFAKFVELTRPLPRPLRILDVGGTVPFWEMHGWAGLPDVHITTVNLTAGQSGYENIECVKGDATNLNQYADGDFDVAFSNSVIEHLFTFESQRAMASEMSRVARMYWVQTPNYWFPMEPHFCFPGWQWLPEPVRVALLRRRGFGFRGRCPDLEAARECVREVRLMTRRELRRLFPDSVIMPERLFGLVKSWIAIRGFPAQIKQSA